MQIPGNVSGRPLFFLYNTRAGSCQTRSFSWGAGAEKITATEAEQATGVSSR